MRSGISFAMFVCFLGCVSIAIADPRSQEIGRSVAERVADHLDGQQVERPVLRLVYFHGADADPLDDYTARWQRILDDISSFYQDEMERNGFGPLTFDYERKDDGTPMLHMVKGRFPSSRYDYGTGREIMQEVRPQLDGVYDVDREFTLVIHGLCDVLGENDYRFHAPYYGEGWSSWRGGVCHVADCPVLDPSRLTDTKTRVKYVEHSGQFRQTMADFNTKYLGGVAHELGHGFGLPHNAERPIERFKLGPALMGGGNHTYRRDVWSERRGSFLTAATCLQMAAHPLFVGRTKDSFEVPNVRLRDLRIRTDDNTRLVGEIEADIEPTSVIAYADPEGGSNYDAQVAVSEVVDGTFSLPIDFAGLKPGEFRLASCHLNGGVQEQIAMPMETRRGAIDGDALGSRLMIAEIERGYFNGGRRRAIELAEEALQQFPKTPHRRLLEAITNEESVQNRIAPQDADGDSLLLGNAAWSSADVGWQKPARNFYAGRAGNGRGRFLSIGGQYFATGLYAHAPSRYVFDLGKEWESFETTVGFQHGGKSEAVWSVVGDGKELTKTKPIKPDGRVKLMVDVTGVDTLELVVKTTAETNSQCWTIWGDPKLSR